MAKSSSHKFGQMIGDMLEYLMRVELEPIAKEYNMYLDYKHIRKARNGKKEVIWTDDEGNKHKLDIVIEAEGDDEKKGYPKAFIELAWRRYKKHSKNKAQEIAGAILPIVRANNKYSPFYGVILAGEFTKPSLEQLKSQGFKVLYFDIDTIIKAFAVNNMNIEWKEDTEEENFDEYIKLLSSWKEEEIDNFLNFLLEKYKEDILEFKTSLKECFSRTIKKIRVFTLHGISIELESVEEAIQYVSNYDEKSLGCGNLVKYEIYVKYNNGDTIEVEFKEKRNVIGFLQNLI
ncbi:hypothetical protein QTG92_11365 [Clostridium perfringens]|nr:hypothetical protein [Clostridium perfringens]